MKNAPVVLAALAAMFSPGVSYAQTSTDTTATSPLSGSVAFMSDYSDYDGFVYNDEPVAEVDTSLDLGHGFSLNVYGVKGVTQSMGDELDVGASYTRELAPGTEFTVSISRDFLQGNDITEFGASITHGPVSVELNYYAADNSADAFRIVGGYTLPLIGVSERLELRGLLAYEKGFDLPDIALVGAEASFRLNNHWSLEGLYMQPIVRTTGDPRTKQLTLGLRFNF